MNRLKRTLVVCVGKRNKEKVYASINNGETDYYKIDHEYDCFDENKYDRLSKKYDTIFTVLGVTKELNGDIRSFILSDNMGRKRMTSPKFFMDLLKSGTCVCMNYNLVNNNGIYHLRKSPNCKIKEFSVQAAVDLVGSYKAENELSENITLSRLNTVMENQGFKLALSQDCEYSLLSDSRVGKYLIYYNVDGTIITFNWLNNNIETHPASLKALRHTDSHKVKSSLKDKSYLFSNITPIDGLNTDITYYNSNKYRTFFDFIEEMERFSTACKPYYVSKNLIGCLDMLNINPHEIQQITKIVTPECTDKEQPIATMFGLTYLGYKKISKYPAELQKFYFNYNEDFIENNKKYYSKKGISIKRLEKIMQLIDYLM